jgi:hypothetical protein
MGRGVLLALMGLLAVLASASAAMAATPQDVYRDFAADGELNASYPRSVLEATLQDASLQEYAVAEVAQQLKPEIQRVLGAEEEQQAGGALPFTGSELALFTLVGMALLGGGLLLRLSARHKKPKPRP